MKLSSVVLLQHSGHAFDARSSGHFKVMSSSKGEWCGFFHVSRTLLASLFWITVKLSWQDRHCPWDKTLPEINPLIFNHSGNFSTINTAHDQSMLLSWMVKLSWAKMRGGKREFTFSWLSYNKWPNLRGRFDSTSVLHIQVRLSELSQCTFFSVHCIMAYYGMVSIIFKGIENCPIGKEKSI